MAEVRPGEETYLSLLVLSPSTNSFVCPVERGEQAVRVTGTEVGCFVQHRGRLSIGCSSPQ